MAWYDEAVFYHIYPLGMTGAPKLNDYGETVERLNLLLPWLGHIKAIGCNAIYIGPLFESVGHGYETTDYRKLDSRLGTNETLKHFVAQCHHKGLKVIFDGVFNHTGRDFFAFRDLKEKRENSPYKDWYCNVNFWGNNSFNDGFSYENWGGYDLLVKLNQRNGAVRDYICDVIRYWVQEFDVDGIRLDAADVLDFDFMKALRRTANEVKPDFWLMGEVIHGDYIRWATADTLHSVTNYHLHKALYSGYNDHNFFEIAHTVKRLNDMGCKKLYNFVDNHDVERIASKLKDHRDFLGVHILLYTLPGIPAIYYGSEFGIAGKKGHGADADAPLRPAMDYRQWIGSAAENGCVSVVAALGHLRQQVKALSYGDYREQHLTTEQFVFSRSFEGETAVVAVNNADHPCTVRCSAPDGIYRGVLWGRKAIAKDGGFSVELGAHGGEIWVPADSSEIAIPVVEEVPIIEEVPVAEESYAVEDTPVVEKSPVVEEVVPVTEEVSVEEPVPTVAEEETEEVLLDPTKPYEEMTVAELQAVILGKMAKNGPVTEYMKKTVDDNTHHGSLVTWAKSF